MLEYFQDRPLDKLLCSGWKVTLDPYPIPDITITVERTSEETLPFTADQKYVRVLSAKEWARYNRVCGLTVELSKIVAEIDKREDYEERGGELL